MISCFQLSYRTILEITELKIKTGSTFHDVVYLLKQNKQIKKDKMFTWLAERWAIMIKPSNRADIY